MKYFLSLIIFFSFHFLLGQSNIQGPSFSTKTDSLQKLLHTQKEDTNRVNILNNLSRELWQKGDYSQAKIYAEDADSLSEKLNFKKGIANAKNNIAIIYYEQGNYTDALKENFSALKIREEIGDKNGIASSHNNIGNIYNNQSDYSNALKEHFAALKLREEIGDKNGIAKSHNNIGNIYDNQGKYEDALREHFAALKLREELGDKTGIGASHNNIGLIYYEQAKYADTISVQKEFLNKALNELSFALKIKQELGDKRGIASSYVNIGNVFILQKKFSDAENYLNNSLALAKEIGNAYVIKESYNGLSHLDSSAGDWKSSLLNYKMFTLYKDSLLNQENIKKSERVRNQYEFDRKEAVAQAEQEKKDSIAHAEARKQTIILFLVIGFLIAASVFIIFISRSLRTTRSQKKTIENQRDNILDSIQYANYIQQSVLKIEREVSEKFPFETFIFFRPRDLVSGDFYWFGSVDNTCILVAADCTGHGVPGALLSMIGNSLLNEIILENKIADPAEILTQMDKLFIKTLGQDSDGERAEDGINVSICAIDTQKKNIRFAGAMNPLYVITNGKLEELDASSAGIGGKKRSTSEAFTNREMILESGTAIYMSSDGYMDQLSGKEKRRIGSRQFKDLLAEVSVHSFREQETKLQEFLDNWQGVRKQTDDILIIGARFE